MPVRHVSTSLRPFAPDPLQPFLAPMDAVTPARRGSSALASMNSGSCYEQVSLFHALDLPIPLSPTTALTPDTAFARYPSARRVSRFCGSRFRLTAAGSPIQNGRIEFVILRMDRSPPAAPHPASRRRSCIRLQAGERLPGEDFHLSDHVRFQAHCGRAIKPVRPPSSAKEFFKANASRPRYLRRVCDPSPHKASESV